uniref:Uncharacterized protein n=1 Tax=Ditylenchus dipsaci TaxID=166011 RepID=A0A915CT16_9BILA
MDPSKQAYYIVPSAYDKSQNLINLPPNVLAQKVQQQLQQQQQQQQNSLALHHAAVAAAAAAAQQQQQQQQSLNAQNMVL